MIRKLLIILLICSIPVTSFASNIEICFSEKETAKITLDLENYDICLKKEMMYSEIIFEYENQELIYNSMVDTYEFTVKELKENVENKDKLLEEHKILCKKLIEAAKPTWKDKAAWGGAGSLLTLLGFLLL